ncbi:hypothetical protein ACLB2K_052065 [Fragaria x ananassa]
MAQNPRPTSILETLGEELVRIITPVSICMFLVVILVSVLSSDSSVTVNSVATIAYTETTSDSTWDKFMHQVLESLHGLLLVYCLGLNGRRAVFMSKMAILVTQGYLVVIGMLVAYWFTLLPEWTTWVLLVAMALYDLAAVLLPVGPLRLLVELAISRDEEIPALVYEARPVVASQGPRRVWRDRRNESENNDNVGSGLGENVSSGLSSNVNASVGFGNRNESSLVGAEEGRIADRGQELSAPLLEQITSAQQRGLEDAASGESMLLEGIGLGSSGSIKLGLGDFIFYSVLVGRAAMYDFMTVYACYLAIIGGLGVTLILLALYQKALPALPVSIMLGVLFYVLTRFLLEAFVVQCTLNLIMF